MGQLLMINSRKRRKAKAKTKTKRRSSGLMVKARSALGSVRRRYRRNPIGGSTVSTAMTQFKAGAIGAAGALAVDVVFAKLPLPANLKTGALKPVMQGLVGIAIGMAVAKFGKNKKLGSELAQGAVTVSLYNAGRAMLAPTLGLSGYDDSGVLGYDDQGMLGFQDLGWYSPAQVSNPYPMSDTSGFDEMDD